MGNMFAPSLDLWIKRYKAKAKEKAERQQQAVGEGKEGEA
jgi:hypothetical protein